MDIEGIFLKYCYSEVAKKVCHSMGLGFLVVCSIYYILQTMRKSRSGRCAQKKNFPNHISACFADFVGFLHMTFDEYKINMLLVLDIPKNMNGMEPR